MNDIIKKTRRQLPKWEEVFANHKSDKRVGSRIWKECLQPNNKKAKNKIETWAKDLNRPFSKDDKHMANKYRKRCSTSSVSREKQIKTTVRSRLTCTRMARFTTPEDKCWENVDQLECEVVQSLWKTVPQFLRVLNIQL